MRALVKVGVAQWQTLAFELYSSCCITKNVAVGNNMAASSPHVQFPEGVKIEERHKPKQQPTQKYDRKEIQKRLEIESWMEDHLAELYQDTNYPQLDIDDVLKINEVEREQKLTEYLQESKKPADSFITELLEKAKGVKPISS